MNNEIITARCPSCRTVFRIIREKESSEALELLKELLDFIQAVTYYEEYSIENIPIIDKVKQFLKKKENNS